MRLQNPQKRRIEMKTINPAHKCAECGESFGHLGDVVYRKDTDKRYHTKCDPDVVSDNPDDWSWDLV